MFHTHHGTLASTLRQAWRSDDLQLQQAAAGAIEAVIA